MSPQRILGIETEYGVLSPSHPRANPIALSSQVVLAYREAVAPRGGRTRWDYDDEDPLLDARGFRMERASAHPSVLTDDPTRAAPSGDRADGATASAANISHRPRSLAEGFEDPGAANAVLVNGGRLYVDHAHPEYSTPEVATAREAVVWDRAGEAIMLAALRAIDATPGLMDVALYKNNVDGKGATYGTHENYLVDRAVPFGDIVTFLTPFFVTRQVFAGAGRVGIGPTGARAGFQLSQRADYIEAEVGLETTLRRPIINTRDEPHAQPERYRRLHVINGDATMLEAATYLRVGTAALVLWALEHLDLAAGPLAGMRLVDPVGEFRAVSHDVTLAHRLQLADGRRLTALQIQAEYLRVVEDGLTRAGELDTEAADLVLRWQAVIDDLGRDPMLTADRVEWVAKLRLFAAMAERDSLAWDHPRLAAMDLQWSDIRPEKGLYHRLARAGRVERLVDDAEVSAAATAPPPSTRAYFRGTMMRRFGAHVVAASWDSVVLDIPGEQMLQRVATLDPHRGTRDLVGPLFAASSGVVDLLNRLRGGLGSSHDVEGG